MSKFPVSLPGAKADTLMWANVEDIEHQALDQLRTVSKLPWVEKLRVMPDVHYGMGATVGSVIAMRDAVSPSAVGVDIGCGMSYVPLNLTVEDLPDDLSALRFAIEAAVPVGFNSHNGHANLNKHSSIARQFDNHMSKFSTLRAENVEDRESRALAQCGTLGGGNHFIEIVSDENDNIGIMLHSGSRNIGKELAERHINQAKTLEHNLGLPDRNLAVFLADTNEMSNYLYDLNWAQEYARINRAVMMEIIKGVVSRNLNVSSDKFGAEISCHHNYVSVETYDGVELIVTRKGAISAQKDQMGIIPGSMGTGSYIVKGLGNTDGLCSASHGAGRKMSRSKAKKTFTVDDLAAQTSGVECRKDQGVVDEIPGAYKDLKTVIDAQSNLVSVEKRLTTLLCVKG